MKYQAIVTEKEEAKITKWLKKTEQLDCHYPFVGYRDTRKVGRRHLELQSGTDQVDLHASDLELRAANYLRHRFKDVTLKTQVPQLPLETTIAIANELEVVHPREWKTKAAKTMSTDIVLSGIDRKTGQQRNLAVFVRYINGLYTFDNGEPKPIRREWEKIRIAEIYETTHQNREFIILTEKDLPKHVDYSIKWLNEYKNRNYSEQQLIDFVTVFLNVFENDPMTILEDILEDVSSQLNQHFQDSLNIFRFCGVNHYIPVDISHRISLSSTIKISIHESFRANNS